MSQKPIKRDEALKPFSREHHFNLLLCWKIREGFKKNVEIKRIKYYVDWCWNHHIRHHFELEEQYIFPVLGKEHTLIQQALKEHAALRQYFTATSDIKEHLNLIEKELDAHIRFEEREVFNEVQKNATPEELSIMEKNHQAPISDNWEDEFWV